MRICQSPHRSPKRGWGLDVGSPPPQTLDKGSRLLVAVVVMVGEVADASAGRHVVTIHHSRICFIIRRIIRIQTQLGSKSHLLERNRNFRVGVDMFYFFWPAFFTFWRLNLATEVHFLASDALFGQTPPSF